MINNLVLSSMFIAILIGGCMAVGMAQPPDYITSQMSRSPLPPGSMADVIDADSLPDDVGGPM